ncbi:3121_t:CDS:2, partial [Acaulospora morrowiae]
IPGSDAPPETPRSKGPRVSISTNSPHKPLLTKEMIAKITPIVIPGLKSLIPVLEAQHDNIFDEINGHMHDQNDLAYIPTLLSKWLRYVLSGEYSIENANVYEDRLCTV